MQTNDRTLICPPSRRGHRWIRVVGKDHSLRVCQNCGTPGQVDAQGVVKVAR